MQSAFTAGTGSIATGRSVCGWVTACHAYRPPWSHAATTRKDRPANRTSPIMGLYVPWTRFVKCSTVRRACDNCATLHTDCAKLERASFFGEYFACQV
jgi:hypothetical protein